MFKHFFCTLALGIALLSTVGSAQDVTPAAPKAPAAPITKKTETDAPFIVGSLSSPNKIDGLELPADQEIKDDEGFIKISATTSETVKWLLLSNVKVKYLITDNQSILLSVPRVTAEQQKTIITLFASTNKTNGYARTAITVVSSNETPVTPPNTPNTTTTKILHITFVLDLDKSTPAQAQIMNSVSLRTAIKTRGYFMRIYDIKSPVLKNKNLLGYVNNKGGPPVMIIQNNNKDSNVQAVETLPSSEAEILSIIDKEAKK